MVSPASAGLCFVICLALALDADATSLRKRAWGFDDGPIQAVKGVDLGSGSKNSLSNAKKTADELTASLVTRSKVGYSDFFTDPPKSAGGPSSQLMSDDEEPAPQQPLPSTISFKPRTDVPSSLKGRRARPSKSSPSSGSDDSDDSTASPFSVVFSKAYAPSRRVKQRIRTPKVSDYVFPFPTLPFSDLPGDIDTIHEFHCLMQQFTSSKYGNAENDAACSIIAKDWIRIDNRVVSKLMDLEDLADENIVFDSSTKEWKSGDLHCLAFLKNDSSTGAILFRHMEGGGGAEGQYAQAKYSVEGYKMMLNRGAAVTMPNSVARFGSLLVRGVVGFGSDSDFDKAAKQFYTFFTNFASLTANTGKGSNVKFIVGGWSLGGSVAQIMTSDLPSNAPKPTAVVAVAGNGPVTDTMLSNDGVPVVNFVDIQNGRSHDNVPLTGCYMTNQYVCFQQTGRMAHDQCVYKKMWREHWTPHLYQGLKDSVKLDNPPTNLAALELDETWNPVFCMKGHTWNQLCGTCRNEDIRTDASFKSNEITDGLRTALCPHIKW